MDVSRPRLARGFLVVGALALSCSGKRAGRVVPPDGGDPAGTAGSAGAATGGTGLTGGAGAPGGAGVGAGGGGGAGGAGGVGGAGGAGVGGEPVSGGGGESGTPDVSAGEGGEETAGGTAGTSAGMAGTAGVGGGGATGTPPSCQGLVPACGDTGTRDCCATDPVPEGTAGSSSMVRSFRLDRYEVTVGRFRQFVAAYEAGYRPADGSGSNPNDPQAGGFDVERFALPDDITPSAGNNLVTWTESPTFNEYLPMNYLDWPVAFAFCIWDGGRLPTRAEWIHVARGGDEQRAYPWSNPPTDRTLDISHAAYDCMADGSAAGMCTLDDLITVGSKPAGNGRWGHADLSGNVWEWTRDDATFGGRPSGYACGGAFFDIAQSLDVRCMTGPPNFGSGVRCAR